MNHVEFLIEDQKLLLKHHQKNWLPLLNKSALSEINSVGYFYAYNGEMVKQQILFEALKKQSLPVILISSWEHYLPEKIQHKYPDKNLYSINICKERNDFFGPHIDLIFKAMPDDFKEKLIKQNENNDVSMIVTSVDFARCEDSIQDMYKMLFFDYLSNIALILKEVKKTIVMFHLEVGVFSPEKIQAIHQTIKEIKNLRHIVVFTFHSYDDIADEDFPLFGEDGLYEHCLISTMGYGNSDLAEIGKKNLYNQLPEKLKKFLNDKELPSYLKYRNFYSRQHQISVINNWNSVKLCK